MDATKINKKKENKKWVAEEIEKMLIYIQDVGNFERPTAQIFYRKLLENTKINASWDLVRWKTRHLKTSFNKAETWKNSTGAGLQDSDKGISSVKDKIKIICPWYDQLKEIFGEKKLDINFNIYESINEDDFQSDANFCWPCLVEESITENEECIIESEECIIESEECIIESEGFQNYLKQNKETKQPGSAISNFEIQPEQSGSNSEKSQPGPSKSNSKNNQANSSINNTQVTPPTPVSKVCNAKKFTEKLKQSAPKTALDKISTSNKEKIELSKLKIELEREKIKNEKKFQEKKLKLEEMEIEEERAKREQEYELRKLKIGKDERIRMFEIEMKYKDKNN